MKKTVSFFHQSLPSTIAQRGGWLMWSVKTLVPLVAYVPGLVYVMAPVLSFISPTVNSIVAPIVSHVLNTVGPLLLDGAQITLSFLPIHSLLSPAMAFGNWIISMLYGPTCLVYVAKALVIGGVIAIMPRVSTGIAIKVVIGLFDVVVLLGRTPSQQFLESTTLHDVARQVLNTAR